MEKKLLTWIQNKETRRIKNVWLAIDEPAPEGWKVVYRDGILDSGEDFRPSVLDGEEHWKRLFGDLNRP